jgi:MmyB-like transcription regulator ligand binding domain
MLGQHEPFPAVVLDRGWQVQRANNGAQRLFGRLFAPRPVPAPANVLRLVIEPGPMRDQLRNWAAVVPALLDVARLLTEPDLSPGIAPIVDLHFDMAGTSFRFFSVVSTIGAPIDVTAQELRVEAFFPADDETRDRWTSFAVSERASPG